jgi:MFS family permease
MPHHGVVVLDPHDLVTDADVERGLRRLTLDGVFSQVMGALTGGAFLAGYALLLGASNLTIGLLAAVGPFSQILQMPATLLVERVGHRKRIVIAASLLSRLCLVAAFALPLLLQDDGARLLALVGALAAYFAFGSISGCAYTSWIRDLVPERVFGSYFGHRLAVATGAGAVATLVGGLVVDRAAGGAQALPTYAGLFAVGALMGLIGLGFLGTVPEPRLPRGSPRRFRDVLSPPLRDPNFRRLLVFLGAWSFALNFATPFFTVYMLEELEVTMVTVVLLVVVSQVANVVCFGLWGRLADRYSNKSVLAVAAPLFLATLLMWPFTTMPGRWTMTVPLLVAIHVLVGISTAGTLLCAGNIALRIAPKGQSTSYLAANALVCGVAASLAPLAGGLLGDALQPHRLDVRLDWVTEHHGGEHASGLPAISLGGLDFVFLGGFLLGIVSLSQLVAVQEEGEVDDKVLLGELGAMVRRGVAHVSSIAGIRRITYFPYALLRRRGRPR